MKRIIQIFLITIANIFICSGMVLASELETGKETQTTTKSMTTEVKTTNASKATTASKTTPKHKKTTKPKQRKKQSLKKLKVQLSSKSLKKYLSSSAFVGSSIGVGQKMYLDYEGTKYLGHPKMLVKGCYSFANDKGSGEYRISYGGYKGPAKYVIKRSGVKKVFINMGTNDMGSSASNVFASYKSYLKGIRKVNPKIRIYIESMSPVYSGGQKGSLNNRNVNVLNSLLKKYCVKQKDMYYIDITSVLKDGAGGLKKAYTSDNYVHLTMAGYRTWTKKLVKDVKKILLAEKKATKAVKFTEKRKLKIEYNRAHKLVKSLPKSTVRSNLLKRLKKVKSQCE